MSASSRIDRIFLRGLAAFVPMALTIYIVYWLVTTAETVTRNLLSKVVPDALKDYLFPGLGLFVVVLIIFALGFFLGAYLARVLYELLVRVLMRIPVVKSIYGMLRDMLDFFTQGKRAKYNRVVMVKLFGQNMRVIGFVTREDFSELPAGIGNEGDVCVYLPMSYQLGGYVVMVPREAVEPIEMSMEDALRFAVTAGMGGKDEDTKRKRA